MRDEQDDDRPETAERDAASGSFTPDLTAAFFAELDAGEPPPLHGGLEPRLETLLDLTTAFDRLVDARSGTDLLPSPASLLPEPEPAAPERSALGASAPASPEPAVSESAPLEPASPEPLLLEPALLEAAALEAASMSSAAIEPDAPEPESLIVESLAGLTFEAAPIDAMFGDTATPAESEAIQPPAAQTTAPHDSSAIPIAMSIAVSSPIPIGSSSPSTAIAQSLPTVDTPQPQPLLADDAAADVPLDLEEFIVFSLADTRCVVPIRNVVEVGRIPEAAPVPHAPAWLHGLGNLRGQVLSLIDLRAFLGLGRIRPSAGRMIVLRADADDVIAGLMVDQVHQIVQLAPSRFQAAPSTLAPGYGGFVWGVCDYGLHTMIGLDVDGVLGAEALHGDSVLAV